MKRIFDLTSQHSSNQDDVFYHVLDLSKSSDRRTLNNLYKNKKVWKIIDETAEQQCELFFIKNPKAINSIKKNGKRFTNLKDKQGKWIYYPWSGCLVHIVGSSAFKLIRTSRNKNLITSKEQEKFEKITVAFAGLNVGNAGAIAVALEGGSIKMRLADNDCLSLSNMNRFRGGIQDLGTNKTILTARQVYEINPFAKLKIFEKGLNEKNINSFLLNPRVDILIEEMDQLDLKIEIRKIAKRYKIPVVMVTGNGDRVILDIERYDKNPNLPILNGKLSKKVYKKILESRHTQSAKDFAKLCRDFIGQRYLTDRLKKSFDSFGGSLAGIPQLAEVSFLRGAVLAQVVRHLAMGNKHLSGRYSIKII